MPLIPPMRLDVAPGVVDVKVVWPIKALAAWPDEKSCAWLAVQARRKTNKALMFGDNSREALGLTINYNKAPDVSQDFLVSALQNSCAQWDLYMFTQLEVTAAEVKRRLDAGEVLNLIDVREPDEYQVCRIDGATLI